MRTIRLPDGLSRDTEAPNERRGVRTDVRSTGRSVPSRFERIAADNENLPAQFGDLIGLLLQAVYSDENVWRPVLRPLWAEEGMHRAHAMLRLLEPRADMQPDNTHSGLTAEGERALARSLACCYRSLTAVAEDDVVPCSTVLRDVAQNLAALFGGNHCVVDRTDIERVSLPAYKRRALVLCASELLINALTHAFGASSTNACVELSLRRLNSKRICLRIADNGIGFLAGSPKPWSSIAGGLAELLESNLRYRRTGEWMTVADVTFPLASIAGISAHGRTQSVISRPDLGR